MTVAAPHGTKEKPSVSIVQEASDLIEFAAPISLSENSEEPTLPAVTYSNLNFRRT